MQSQCSSGPLGSVELLEDIFNVVRARWTGEVEIASVPIVDSIDVIWRCDHVEVEVCPYLGHFASRLVDFHDISLRAQ